MERGSERRGIALLIAAALAFSVMSTLVKLAGARLPVAMLVLARSVVTLALSLAWLRVRGVSPWGVDKPRLLLRGAFGVGGLYSFFFAVTRLPLAEATILHYLNPLLTTLLAAFVLKEVIDRRLLLALPLGLVGATLVIRPAFLFEQAAALDTAGVFAALLGATFSAFAYVTVRRLRRTDHPDVIVFYFPLVALPATLPWAVMTWVPPSPTEWLLLLALGTATQIGQVLLTHGLVLVPAGRATTVGYVQVLFAAAWGLVVFDMVPVPWTLVGAALVAVGIGVLIWGAGQRSAGGQEPATAPEAERVTLPPTPP